MGTRRECSYGVTVGRGDFETPRIGKKHVVVDVKIKQGFHLGIG